MPSPLPSNIQTEAHHSKLTSQLQIPLLVDQQVLRLQIPMKDPMGVTEVKTFDELVGELLLGVNSDSLTT